MTAFRPTVTPLEAREVPAALTAVGAGAGGGPRVQAFDPAGALVRDFFAYESTFTGGVRAVAADLTGDGIPDIATAPGPGGGPLVTVFDGATGRPVRAFFAYEESFRGGANLALGDVTGDGRPDLVVGAGVGGGPRVRVFDGATGGLVRDFFAYDPTVRSGVTVAAGDLSGDGRAEVVTGAGVGGGPHVKAFDGLTGQETASFMAFDPGFRGGVSVAAGDVDGDGKAELVVGPGPGGPTAVRVFGGPGLSLREEIATVAGLFGGVAVTVGDLSGDGRADVVAAPGSGAGSTLTVFDGKTGAELRRVEAFGGLYFGGVNAGSGFERPAPSPPPPAPAPTPTYDFGNIISIPLFGNLGPGIAGIF